MRWTAFAVVALATPAEAEALFNGAPHVAVAPQPHQHPPGGIGGTAAFGYADDGWVARLEYELLPVMAANNTSGAVMGFVAGFEGWRDGDDMGLAMPIVWAGGVKLFPVRLMLGAGLEMLTTDRVDGDWGAGSVGPLAMANLSFDVFGVRVGLDARATRHLNFGAPDFNQLQLAISVGYTWSSEIEGEHGTPEYY